MGNTQLTQEMFALINFSVCAGVIGICLCRLNCMSKEVIIRVRSVYVMYLTAALTSALQPMYGEWPGWGNIAMSSALLFNLLMSSRNWANGPPHEVKINPQYRRIA